jgi:hypothetical protein
VTGEIDSQIAAGKLVVVMFWQPKSAVDQYVHAQLGSALGAFGSAVAVHYALPSQVNELGTWTGKVLVTETPTILIITPSNQVTALAGFTDSAYIAQNIDQRLGSTASASHAAQAQLFAATQTACLRTHASVSSALATLRSTRASQTAKLSAARVVVGAEASAVGALAKAALPASLKPAVAGMAAVSRSLTRELDQALATRGAHRGAAIGGVVGLIESSGAMATHKLCQS